MSPYKIKLDWKGTLVDLECRVSNTDLLEFNKELKVYLMILDQEFLLDKYYVKGSDILGYMILDKDFKFTGESYMTLEDCQKAAILLFTNSTGDEDKS